MAVYVKENTISLFLLSISDLVRDEIARKRLSTASPNFTKLASTTPAVDVNNSFEILRRESELFSFNPMPTANMAAELYRDLEEQQTRSDEYVIHHDIVFKTSDNSFYKFNIEKENERNTNIFQDPEEPVTGFYIQSIQIKNAPKDIFTTRANYTITIKILFNFFDDLLRDDIDVYPIGTDLSDPLSTTIAANLDTSKLALIKILYKKYFSSALGVINNMQDREGIYLVQRMQFKNNTIKFNETRDEAGVDQLGRTFHLISKQHEFNICKSNEPAFSAFDNELTITYVASEVEELPEQGKSLIEVERKNLFNLLNNRNTSSVTTSTINSLGLAGSSITVDNLISNLSYYKGEIQKFQEWQNFIKDKINCFELADKLKISDPSKSAQYLSKAQSGGTNGQPLTLDELKKNLTANKEKIDAVIFEMNRALMFEILLNCEIFELKDIQNSLLNSFEQAFLFQEYFKNLDASRATALGAQIIVGTALSVAFAPQVTTAAVAQGAAITTGLSLLPEVGALVSEISKEPLVSSELDIPKIRNSIANSLSIQKITTSSSSQQQQIQAIFPSLQTTSYGSGVGGSVFVNAGSVLLSTGRDARGKEKEIQKELQQSLAIEAPEAENTAAVTGTSNIRFIRFSDIIKIYKKLNSDVNIISGGKMILKDVSRGNPLFVYLNNADYLISLEAFSNFLYKNIILKDRKFFYDSEEFLRDAFQTLLGKDILSGNDSVATEIKKIAPTNLRFNTSINVNDAILNSALTNGDFDILNNGNFTSLKRAIFKTRNIAGRFYNSGSTPRFVKLLFLGSDQDIKYYDFYDKYNTWLLSQPITTIPTQLSSTTFQKFINEEYLMPCIPVRNSATTETILKSKNITFSRIDNKNLESGVILADETVRLPYQIKAKLQPYLSLFLGASNYIFVTPPEISNPNNRNIFGFGGLYIIKQTTYEWNFVNAAGANPVYSSYLDIDGYHVSYGDGIKLLPPNPSGSPPTLCE